MDARGATATAIGLCLLGCSGLLPATQGPRGIPEHLQGIEQARLEGRYTSAETRLQQYLAQEPSDADAWRMMGDLQITRGQKHAKKWRENLSRARDAYRDGILADPTDCSLWTRLGMAVAAGAHDEQTASGVEFLQGLPLADAWQHCGAVAGAGPLAIVDGIVVSEEAAAEARSRLGPRATAEQVRAAAVPELAGAFGRFDTSGYAWTSIEHPSPAAGRVFVVLRPTTARGLDGSPDRSIRTAEDLTAASVGSGDIEFVDRRDPATNTRDAFMEAAACGARTGSRGCRAGPANLRASAVYAAAVLRPAGTTHFQYESIAKAVVPEGAMVPDSVTCTGGPLGRMFVDTPSCPVTYAEPSQRRRSVPRTSGLAAWDARHASSMITAWRMRAILGDELADHLARGEYAKGMPYAMFAYSQADMTDCSGEGLMSRATFADGALLLTCRLRDVDYRFEEMALVSAVPAR